MNKVLLAAALLLTQAAFANELDNLSNVPAALPGTVVVRVSKSNPNDVAVAHLPGKLKPGQKFVNGAFEQMALNQEKTGIAFGKGSELDNTSSTSSWGFAWGRPGGGGWGGGWGRGGWGGGGWGGGGWGGGGWVGSTPYGYGAGCGQVAYVSCNVIVPQYTYNNIVYVPQPYYGWADNNYYYNACGW